MGKSEEEYKIDAQGSLGLLALGDVGVKLWKEKLKIAKAQMPPQSKKKKANKDVKKTGK